MLSNHSLYLENKTRSSNKQYKNKLKKLKNSIKDFLFENAAICDQVILFEILIDLYLSIFFFLNFECVFLSQIIKKTQS